MAGSGSFKVQKLKLDIYVKNFSNGNFREALMESREKEVKIIMKWILDNPFVLSISFHDGRVMINYPWDDSPEATEGQPATCSDNDVFSALSSLYANNHPFMWTG